MKSIHLSSIHFFVITLLIFIVVFLLTSQINKVSAHDTNNTTIEKNLNSVSRKKTFTYSTNGRIIDGYEIGEGGKCIFLYAGMHGNEKGGSQLLEKLANEVITNPDLVNSNNRVVIIPIINPDGYFDRDDKLNANGININRNFPTKGWQSHESDDKKTNGGPEPFSEIESRLIRDVVESCSPGIMIAFHAKGHLVAPENNLISKNFAKWYAENTSYHYFDEWKFAGTATGWYEEVTGDPAITVELSDYLSDDWDINKKVLLKILSINSYPVYEI